MQLKVLPALQEDKEKEIIHSNDAAIDMCVFIVMEIISLKIHQKCFERYSRY